MSRSGYSDDCEYMELWRGAVHRAICGKRGQALLVDMRDALDALPEKRLAKGWLRTPEGEVCALGAVAARRGLSVDLVDPSDRDEVAKLFGVAPALVAEIAFHNDDDFAWRSRNETPEERWLRVRQWCEEQIRAPAGEVPS